MRIDTEADLEQGLAALARLCPLMAEAHAAFGTPPLRRRPAGFEGLAHIIAYQQISLDAAAAIWARTRHRLGGAVTAEAVLAAREEDLRAAGQSRPKISALRAVAAAVADGTLDLDGLAGLPAEEAHRALVRVRGIGPWTADIYLLSCLGHADAWPAGDIALQSAAGDLLGLGRRPRAAEMGPLAERWRPWRAVAARLLWARYGARRGRAAAPLGT